MKVQKKTSVAGDWAKVGTHIKDADRLKLLDAGQKVDGEFGQRDVFRILTAKREELNMSFNQTSMNNLIDAWGDDTEAWVSKVVKVFVIKQRVGDGLKNVAYLAPEGWTMNDDGKFINPEREQQTQELPPRDDINPDDIPF